MAVRPRTFNQAALKHHSRHGKHYDPEAARKGPWLAIGAGAAALCLAVAGIFAYTNLKKLNEEKEFERMRPIRSAQLYATIQQYHDSNRGDDRIEAVRAFINERMPQLEMTEQGQARDLLLSLDSRKKQVEFRAKVDRLLADVRSMSRDPEFAEQMNEKAEQLEKLLMDLDDDRSKDVKNEIFVARGKSAVGAAKFRVAKIDASREKGDRDWSKLIDAYEKADKDLADVLPASRLPETKEIRDDIAAKINSLAEAWVESSAGFGAAPSRDLLQPKEFAPAQGETIANWQSSPGAKFTFNGSSIVMEGVKPDKPQGPGERAGIVFWSPSPTTAMKHYELQLRVKIHKIGFGLLARQSSGYMRHLYDFEALPPGVNSGDQFYPQENHKYDITQRVYGKKVHINITNLDPDETLPSSLETNTSAREGGIGFLLKLGAKIEVESCRVKILR
jgi:hypothetical protein